jgi:hypothetical protein
MDQQGFISTSAVHVLHGIAKYCENIESKSPSKHLALARYSYMNDILYNIDPYVPQDWYVGVSGMMQTAREFLEKRYGELEYAESHNCDEAHECMRTIYRESHNYMLNIYEDACEYYYNKIFARRVLYEIDKILGWWLFL